VAEIEGLVVDFPDKVSEAACRVKKESYKGGYFLLEKQTITQILRYGSVGVAHNFIGYLIYLLIVSEGIDPKMAVTICFPFGATFSYFTNKRWTFSYAGAYKKSISRFCIAHLLGYGLNILMLYYFVNVLHLPHELIQAISIFVVAGFLFLIFRFFVFRT